MVKGMYIMAVTLMSAEEFFLSFVNENREKKGHKQKATFLRVEYDAP